MTEGRTAQKGKSLSLSLKLALYLVLSTICFWALFGVLNLRLQRRQSEQTMLQDAERLSEIIQRSTRHQMLRNDRPALAEVITEIGSQPGIRLVRVFNKEGRISYSSTASELETMVDKRAEQCYACHAQSAPLQKLNRPDRARIFTDPQGGRVLGIIRPVENQPDCWSAPCHAHPREKRILGVIDTQLSLETVDQQMAAQGQQLLGFTALAAALVSAITLLFVWLVVRRPIRELIAGTRRVSSGDLDFRIPVRSHDELGVLASSFNKMTQDLGAANSEVLTWAHTLEDRVRYKSQELERAYSSLVASEKMASLGKLAATVAHEINNPLFGMLTYARLTLKRLAETGIDPAQKEEMMENLRVIERESRRCGDIIKNLLTYVRQAPPKPQRADLNQIVERALGLVRHKLDLQGIECEESLAPDLPPVWCDPGQIQQVAVVLLMNATEAMSQGGQMLVTTSAVPEGGVRLVVADNGGGIPEDVMPHIFEPFFSTKEEQQRTGLGLAVAHSIVEQHAGTITVRSTPGQGTEFTVTLPGEPKPQSGSGPALPRTTGESTTNVQSR
ncbi:MAG: HAMP domain-containing protein [Acidobacteriales bacterium]|nr:HAMP domain-containing protein [Terriglobales bacterium]